MPRIVLLVFTLSVLTSAQTTTSSSITKDATAVAIAQESLAAMGGSNLASYQDVKATGNVTIYAGSSKPTTFPVAVKAKGTRELRTEITKPSGIQVWATDGAQGCMNYGQLQSPVANENLLAQRVDYFPVLSLLAEYANSNMNVQNAGTATVSGRAALVIALSFTPSDTAPQGTSAVSMTQRLFYVDQQTGMVLKMQLTRYADNAPGSGFKLEMYFSDYQAVSGLLLPMKVDSFLDSRQVSTLSLTSLSLNTGLQDSEFSIACGGGHAR